MGLMMHSREKKQGYGGMGGRAGNGGWRGRFGVTAVIGFWLSFSILASGKPISYRGIAPQDVLYYSSSVIKCRDGSKSVPSEQVNDNFCDCLDGTDEPGTSACPDGVFFCGNRGHTPKNISSIFVNDGICDCCDGSDEWDGRKICGNTCKDLGSEARNQLIEASTTLKEGLKLRKKFLEEGQDRMRGWKSELNQLKEKKKIVEDNVTRLRELKEAVEKAEQEEREREEHERKAREEADKKEAEARGTPNEPLQDSEAPSSSPPQTCGEALSGESCKGVAPAEVAEQSGDAHASESSTSDHLGEDAKSRGGGEQTITLEDASEDKSTEHRAGEEVEVKSVRDLTEEEMAALSNEEIGRLVASRWTGKQVVPEDKKKTMPDANENGDAEDEPVPLTSNEEDRAIAKQAAELAAASVEERESWDRQKDGHSSEDDDELPVDSAEYGHHEGGHDDDLYHEGSDDEESYYKQAAEKEEEEEEEEEGEDGVRESENDSQTYSADTEDSAEKPKESWWSRVMMKLPRGLHSKVQRLFKRPETVPTSEGGRIRLDYSKASRKFTEISRKMNIVEENLKKDYGPDGALAVLQGECFELTEKQYVYKICPYGTATQNEGHSSTTLGSWGGWKDNYSTMVFENGQQCWNGPQRSLKVATKCGLTTKLLSVTEPSRCEYFAELSTPLSCREDQLKEVEERLKGLDADIAVDSTHDEF